MIFDWTINFGTVIHLLVLVVSLVGLYYKVTSRMDKVEAIVQQLWEAYMDDVRRLRDERDKLKGIQRRQHGSN